jgi:hypothetical protein
MPFTIKTTMNVVLEEYAAAGYPPMLLPWEKRMTADHTTARMGGGVIPPGSNNVTVDFPGITTLTTLWFYPEVAMSVIFGAANAEPIDVQAGGCVGFTQSSLDAASALRVTYTGTDPGGYSVVWAGD